jgi:hypothetical protein
MWWAFFSYVAATLRGMDKYTGTCLRRTEYLHGRRREMHSTCCCTGRKRCVMFSRMHASCAAAALRQNLDDALAKLQEIIDRAVEYVTPKEADPETIKRVKAQ